MSHGALQQSSKFDGLIEEIERVIGELQESGFQTNELIKDGQSFVDIKDYMDMIDHYVTVLQTIRDNL